MKSIGQILKKQEALPEWKKFAIKRNKVLLRKLKMTKDNEIIQDIKIELRNLDNRLNSL